MYALLVAAVGARPRSCRRHFPGQGRRSSFENDVSRGMERLVAEAAIPAAHASVRSDWRVVRRRRSHHHTRERARKARQHQGLGVSNESRQCHPCGGGRERPAHAAVLIEVKTSAPRAAAAEPGDSLRQVAGAPAWENNRAAAWVVMSGSSGPTHRHVGDAVELVFDGSTTPKATFVPAGTVHAGPTAGDGGRAYIFEIK